MGLNIAAELNVPVLVLVHKDDLAQQWHETLKTFWPEANAGHIQGDKWVFRTKHMVTAMAQTLHARKDSPILPEMHKHCGMVIVDEGQRYSAATFEHILRALPIRYRLGVSATWRRKDGLECLWDWHVGKVVHVMEGSRLTGEYVQIPWKTNLVDAMFKRGNTLLMAAMTTAISKNVPYNIWLATQITSAANAGRRVLVCSDRVAHVLELSHRIRELGFTGSVGHYVAGIPDGVTEKGNPRSKKMSKSELEAAKTCDVVLASYGMISEGTDVPELDTLFLATPRSDVEQVVGRIQRPSGDKRPLLVVDPVFQLGVCHGMAAKRRETYSELGFTQQRKEE
jgi:superfamily II DNA or RNA helicase